MSNASAPPTEPSKDQTQPTAQDVKGKGKVAEDVEMHEAGGEEEEEEEEEDDDGEEEEEEEGIDEDELDELDPSAILPDRRRNRPVVNYASEEALKNAGLEKKDLDDEDTEAENSFGSPKSK